MVDGGAAPTAMNARTDPSTGLVVERGGAGPPLLLVHGLGGPAMLGRVAPILEERFDVILPHLDGFGESPTLERPATIANRAAALLRLLDGIGRGPCTVVGLSYGGEVAARLAAIRPSGVSALVLICPTGAVSPPPLLRPFRSALTPILRRALVSRRVADALSRRSFHDIALRPEGLVERYLDALRRPGRIDALLAAIGELWSGRSTLLSDLDRREPSLTLIWGEEDATVSPASADAITELRHDARIVVIPRAGHSVSLERPGEVAGAIAEAAR